jgi:DNA primase
VGIQDDDVRKVRDATDMVGVVSQYVQLKRVGRRETGLCPFHPEKSPSFSVNPEEGLYYCFGCGAKGDAITFVREIEGLDFVQAVEWLAKRANVTLTYTDANEGAERKQRSRLVDAVRKAVEWYHQRLLTGADAGPARSYLRSRGLDGDLVRKYQIGWAPDEWDALAKALKLPNKILEDSGLGFMNRRKRQQDSFRDRVLFPIFDVQGDPLGFGGRIMPGGDGPKYKNSSDGPLYAKSRVLYGLNWAKAPIVEANEVVVCEGYTDVIGLAQAGVPRGVATCGTALTEEHIRLMKRFASRVVLAFDADAAGQNAAERFYAWEKKYEVDVAVAALPAGVDPADLARKDPEALKTAIEQAVPFLGFRVKRALSAGDLSTPEGRARTAEAALAVIREHPNPLVRDQYVIEVADQTRVDHDTLAAALRRPAGKGEVKAAASGFTARPRRGVAAVEHKSEMEALRLLAHQRDTAVPELHEVLFRSERARAAFVALLAEGSVRAAIDAADPGAAELLSQIAVEEPDPETDVIDVVSQLLSLRVNEVFAELEAEVRSLGAADEGWAQLAEERTWLANERIRLRSRETDKAEREELVRFLDERSVRPEPVAEPPSPSDEVEEMVVEEMVVEDIPPPTDEDWQPEGPDEEPA